jgi:hypothetical protein
MLHSRFVLEHGTNVEFTVLGVEKYLASEQFWGRAVRASCDPKGSGALLNFGDDFSTRLASRSTRQNLP